MIFCKIENGVVVNRAVFESEMPNDWPERDRWAASDAAQIGWGHDGTDFVPPPPPEPEPPPDLDAIDTATLNNKLLEPGSVDRAELRAIFQHENRLRTLEGKSAITQAQFVDAMKALIR